MRTMSRLIFTLFLTIGLVTGCATTGDSEQTAAEAIAAAKEANAKVKEVGYEWRDTAKIIASAEEELAAGNEAEAKTLANKARKQAEDALAQYEAESKKFADNMSAEDAASLSSAESSLAQQRGAGSAAGVTNYTVVRGDNLWDISGKENVYGDSFQWPLIYKTNRNQIKDPDLIYPGQALDIDQNVSADDVDAAVNHAKTRGAWSIGVTEESDKAYLAQ